MSKNMPVTEELRDALILVRFAGSNDTFKRMVTDRFDATVMDISVKAQSIKVTVEDEDYGQFLDGKWIDIKSDKNEGEYEILDIRKS